MATTTNFESGAVVNTAGDYTDAAMAYLQDEVKFDLISGLVEKSKSLHLICVPLYFCFSIYDQETFSLNVRSSKLAEMT